MLTPKEIIEKRNEIERNKIFELCKKHSDIIELIEKDLIQDSYSKQKISEEEGKELNMIYTHFNFGSCYYWYDKIDECFYFRVYL